MLKLLTAGLAAGKECESTVGEFIDAIPSLLTEVSGTVLLDAGKKWELTDGSLLLFAPGGNMLGLLDGDAVLSDALPSLLTEVSGTVLLSAELLNAGKK